jgi:hypothetical protein
MAQCNRSGRCARFQLPRPGSPHLLFHFPLGERIAALCHQAGWQQVSVKKNESPCVLNVLCVKTTAGVDFCRIKFSICSCWQTMISKAEENQKINCTSPHLHQQKVTQCFGKSTAFPQAYIHSQMYTRFLSLQM